MQMQLQGLVCILVLFSVNYDRMLFYHEAKH